jgi:hypothetical protein
MTMRDEEIAAQEPRDIDEALACMERTLAAFEGRRDQRAFFLRVYWEMTREVADAIHRRRGYRGRLVFLDPGWVRRLSGLFATLYFRAAGKDECGRAWATANAVAADERSTVLLNAVLGIVAHIRYDLAHAIADNLDPGELKDPAALQLRKYDHDQVNDLLVATLPRVQAALARYEPGLRLGDRLLWRIDERLSEAGLSHYRERVWWQALALAAARADDAAAVNARRGKEAVVRAELDLESGEMADGFVAKRWLWRLERLLNLWAGRNAVRWPRSSTPTS